MFVLAEIAVDPFGIVQADWMRLVASTFIPLARLGALVLLGALLFRAGIMGKPAVEAMSRLTVALFLPSYIATSILAEFRPGTGFYHGWYVLPLAAVAMIGAVAVLVYPIAHAGRSWLPARRTMATLTFHNAGYLAIPIVSEIYSQGDLRQHGGTMLALLFLFIMGISPLMWSLGVAAMREQSPADDVPGWRKVISPPFAASLASVIACLLHLPQQLDPAVLRQALSPFAMLGTCTVPVMMLILGATLVQLDHSYRPPRWLSAAALAVRLGVVPGLGFAVLGLLLHYDVIDRAKAVILFIESAMPTAVAMTVIAQRYGSERTAHAVSGLIFVQYLAAAATIPVWLTVWGIAFGYEID